MKFTSGILDDGFETQDWLESLEEVLYREGRDRTARLLRQLNAHAAARGVETPPTLVTPYANTIPRERQPPYPGDLELESRIRNIIQWNAIIMVVRANQRNPTLGGHIATYASSATLFEVAFNHFLRGPREDFSGDQVFFQGAATPGVYSRAWLEGRLTRENLENFRREFSPGGLCSYSHPWSMPEFWQFPSASMGLGPLNAIYQARFNRYLEGRGLKQPCDSRVWAFIGDGEMDEPEAMGALSVAAREELDNLTFVINCNLQRLDGPVRGNGKIIQELEGVFRGAGWNVLKVIWGGDWDALLARDQEGLLVQRMGELVDGEYQRYSISPGDVQREHFFGSDPRLMELSRSLSDDQIRTMRRGGHDPEKVYAAYRAAVEHRGQPSVVLAKTVKGYGMGEVGEGRMTVHQMKRLGIEALREIRDRMQIPVSDEQLNELPFYRCRDDSPEARYLLERRRALGGFVPKRIVRSTVPLAPASDPYHELIEEWGGRTASTTMAYTRLLAKLLRDKQLGKHLVPIVADEARTFGMDALFRQYGIYSTHGQCYQPVDGDVLTSYREALDGQIIEEGITEAGALGTFTAAGTSYATHGIPMLPMFIFYSIFGFQRVGDLIYAAGDSLARGFLIGATSGRTTLNGEGIQHQDGHSHILSMAYPHVVSYDASFAYDVAVIMREGIRRMLDAQENVIYYLTVQNEKIEMLPKPAGCEEGILRGLYRVRESGLESKQAKVVLFGSGAMLHQALQAQVTLEERYQIPAEVWSITSFQQLHADACEAEKWNLFHPEEERRLPWIEQCLTDKEATYVVASDFVKALPNSVARWFPRPPVALGTDGFGRSESRPVLRRHFGVDAATMVFAAVSDLARRGEASRDQLAGAQEEIQAPVE